MDKRIKAEWVKRLRDPEAKQCRGILAQEDGSRCCLGVLMDIAVEDGIVGRVLLSEGQSQSYGTDVFYGVSRIFGYTDPETDLDDPIVAILSNYVVKWAGLDDQNPSLDFDWESYNEEDEVGYKRSRATLGELNDKIKLTFPEIANLIKEQL